MLGIAGDACFLEILRLHQLLIRLRVRLHIDVVLHEFQLVARAALLFHVLARGGRGWHLVIVAADRALRRDRSLRLHEGGVHLIRRQHLLCRITKRRPDRLPAVDACRRHARDRRHIVQATLDQVTGRLPIMVLAAAAGVHVLHRHGRRVLHRGGPGRPPMVLLQQRMVALLVAHAAVDLVLSRVPRLYVRKEAIITAKQLVARLPRQHQIGLVACATVHHYFLRLPLILLARRLLVLLQGAAGLQAHGFVVEAAGAFLVVTRDALRSAALLVLVPEHLARGAGETGGRHRVIQLRLVVAALRVLLHFGLNCSLIIEIRILLAGITYLSVVCVVQALIPQIMRATRIVLPLDRSVVLR